MHTSRHRTTASFLALLLSLAGAATGAPAGDDETTSRPAATVDLTTDAGVAIVGGPWRYHDARIIETSFFAPGADGQPSSVVVPTYDLEPRAGAANHDDSAWATVAPGDLSRRRGNGRLSFGWYRLRVTVPDRIGAFDPTGATIVLDVTLDDAAEIWVDGELARHPGQRGGSMIAGWNAPNRLVIARGVQPGQSIQLAVFAVNGPLSDAPTNYIWMREARLEFFPGDAPARAIEPSEVNVSVVRLDPAVDAIISRNPKVHKLAEGFRFTEGPAWSPDGALLFSDPNANRIYRYEPDGTLTVFRESSGYSGADFASYRQPGSNGLAFDASGRLTVCEHGRRRITRLEPDGTLQVLADRYQGRRLNSPNDLVYRSDGSLYFTDPVFGLPGLGDDPRRELPFCGVFRWTPDGEVTLLASDLRGPNGIAFSPDERVLYVGDWDDDHKAVMRYEVDGDGAIGAGSVFCDLTAQPGEDAIDGIKVDQRGNVFVSGPGGVWVFAPSGTALGRIITPRHVHNMAWGDPDRRTLYLCAREGLYRMRMAVPGSGAWRSGEPVATGVER